LSLSPRLHAAAVGVTGGLESFLSVLDAQRAVFAAEDELAQSDKNSVLTLIAVYNAFGGGWSAEGAAPTAHRERESASLVPAVPAERN
jgi:outer membrane protein TolC